VSNELLCLTDDGCGASLLERLRTRAYNKVALMRLQLEVTKRCNLSCQHCYVAGKQRELTTQAVFRLFDEAADEGCLMVTLTGGEVAMRSDWLELAAAVRKRRMMVNVYTNGTLLTEEDCVALAKLKPMFVGVSLYGSRAEVHESITKVPGSFERSVSALRRLRELGVTCQIKNVLMPENLHDVRATGELARRLDCVYSFDPTVSPKADGDASVTEHRVTADELWPFYLEQLYAKPRKVRTDGDGNGRPVARNCSAGFSSAFVDASGDVYPCMGFPPAWGDVSEASLNEIWRGPAATMHRRLMQRELSTCNRCDLLKYCTARCPRLALLEDGDMSGPSHRACELAKLVKRMHDELVFNAKVSNDETTKVPRRGAREVILCEEGVS